jgi:hypothetical protein
MSYIFSTKFYFFQRHMTRRFIVQQLCGHVAYEDVRAIFYFIFYILKYLKYVFS